MKRANHSREMLLLAGLLAATAVLGGVGCQGRASAAKPGTLVVGSEANGKVIAVEGVETVSIKLLGNASTGYQWTLAGMEGDALQPFEGEHPEDAASNPEPPVPGNSSYCYIDFRVLGSGRTRVMLEYRRPWAKEDAPAERFSVTFDVRGKPTARASAAPATSVQ